MSAPAPILAARPVPADLASSLSGRELAVLRSIAEGHGVPATARELGVSPRTVEKHLEHAYRKLGVGNRHAAVAVMHAATTHPPKDSPVG